MQLLDELSMVYTTCVLFYAVFSYACTKPTQYLLLLLITSIAVFITAYYHYIKDPLFHQNMFALLTTIVVLHSIYIMEKLFQTRPIKTGDDRKRLDSRHAGIRRNMRIMIACGIGSVALGFLIWNLDNIFCSTLRRWRRHIGLPWGILLEGHGWWYVQRSAIFTAAELYRGTFSLALLST
jgi:dihydroceramidase